MIWREDQGRRARGSYRWPLAVAATAVLVAAGGCGSDDEGAVDRSQTARTVVIESARQPDVHSLEQLTVRSDLVVGGTVVGEERGEPVPVEGEPDNVARHIVVKVDDVYFGDGTVKPGSEVRITDGGWIGEARIVDRDLPESRTGDELVAFLGRDSVGEAYFFVNGQGKFAVADGRVEQVGEATDDLVPAEGVAATAWTLQLRSIGERASSGDLRDEVSTARAHAAPPVPTGPVTDVHALDVDGSSWTLSAVRTNRGFCYGMAPTGEPVAAADLEHCLDARTIAAVQDQHLVAIKLDRPHVVVGLALDDEVASAGLVIRDSNERPTIVGLTKSSAALGGLRYFVAPWPAEDGRFDAVPVDAAGRIIG